MKHEELKELIRQVVKEESDYQQMFKHMLDKTGQSLPDMSDTEKKAFFNAVDKAHKAKSEGKLRGYNENLPENLTNKIKSKMKSVTESRDSKGNEFPELGDVKAAIKKIIQNDDVEKLLRNKVIAYLQKEKGFTGAGNTNSSRLFDKVINDLLKN